MMSLRTRLAIAVLAVLVTGASCNQLPSPSWEPNNRPPASLQLAVPIRCGIHVGLASPISATAALTASHVSATESACSSFDGSRTYRVVWRNPLVDIAKVELTHGNHFLVYYTRAEQKPFETELLYMRALLNVEGSVTTVVGRYMFMDKDGDMILDGFAQQGMSGGPIVNNKGELVGLTRAIWFPGENLRAMAVGINLVGRKLD